jgi:hypothetical protein
MNSVLSSGQSLDVAMDKQGGSNMSSLRETEPPYLHIKGFHVDSPAAAQVRADVEGRISASDRVANKPPQAGSPIKTLREWRELLGDPPTIGHPLTHAPEPVPLHLFADRDPDSFLLTISWRQPGPNSPASRDLPPAGQPIIELLDG